MNYKPIIVFLIFIFVIASISITVTQEAILAADLNAEAISGAVEQPSVYNWTRQSAYAGSESGTVQWVYKSGFPESSSPVVGANGIVYFSSGNSLFAVDGSGKKLWSWNPVNDSTKLNVPQLDNDGTVFVTTIGGNLYSIDSTGKMKWAFTPTPSKTNSMIIACSCCTLGNDGTIYYLASFKNSNGYEGNSVLYAIHPDGLSRWSVESNKACVVSGPPVINKDGMIFVQFYRKNESEWPTRFPLFPVRSSGSYNLTSIDAFNPKGELQWEQPFFMNSGSSTSIYPDGKNGIFLGVDRTLYNIDQSGKTKYSVQSSDTFVPVNGTAVSIDGCFAFSAGALLYYCNPDGTIQWKFTADSSIDCAPLTDKNSYIYFASKEGNMYSIDKKGGQKWKTPFPGKVTNASPTMRSDGIIYQLTNMGDLNAIGKTKVESLALNVHEVTLLTGGMKGILDTCYYPNDTTNKRILWSSSNVKVATVKDGVVTPVSQGTATIKAASEDYPVSDACQVTVLSKPAPDMTLNCDVILTANRSYYQGVYTFRNLTLKDGINVTSEGISEIELIVNGTLNIGKDAAIRVRNGCYEISPTTSISALTAESIKVTSVHENSNILNLPAAYGKGGNGGVGGDGSYNKSYLITYTPHVQSTSGLYTCAGGGGGGGGYGGGKGGAGGTDGKNFNIVTTITVSAIEHDRIIEKTVTYTPSAINADAGKGLNGDDYGGKGGNVYDDYELFIKDIKSFQGGNGGGSRDIGRNGTSGKEILNGGTGGGGNGGNGGDNGEMNNKGDPRMVKKDNTSGGGGGGGGYGGGVLVVVAGTINVQNSATPCFVVSGQKGGKGGYPNGKDGENGEGGMLIIETTVYRPSLSHWNIGSGSLECGNSGINGGHGTVTGNPQKVFINGKDVSGYNAASIRSLNIRDRSVAFLQKIN